jgi:hypothetical protein
MQEAGMGGIYSTNGEIDMNTNVRKTVRVRLERKKLLGRP